VIVVEAAAKSGTLNTAAHALEQGKELMAVPGNITSPLSAGCNRLIAQGAAPVLSIDDVLARLDLGSVGSASTTAPLGDDDNQTLILQLISGGVNDGDELVSQSKLSTSEVSMSLTMLEINGVVRALGANKWGLR
jgi:DNA processing protein